MDRKKIFKAVDDLGGLLHDISKDLWEHPEVSGEEKRSAELFKKTLADHGFSVRDCGGVDNAFCAEIGSGSPVIAILGEYDALPKMSQKLCASKDPIEEGAPGHGCGHNLLGTAGAIAAIAIAKTLIADGVAGSVRFYGCPREETLDGKVIMVKHGAFDGCDAAISWHPWTSNLALDHAYLANDSIKFKFSGVASHAGAAPELGRSALDAVELMNVGANYLREHVVDAARIHYTTNSGGFPPNIVPPYADSWYYVRAPYRSQVNDITKRLIDVARGAALMAGVELEVERISGCYELSGSSELTKVAHRSMTEIGAPKFSSEDRAFAAEIRKTLSPSQIAADLRNSGIEDETTLLHEDVAPLGASRSSRITASSDVGDVSHIMPMMIFTTACFPIGVSPHTWQAAASVGGSIGRTGCAYAAKVIAGAIADIFADRTIIERAKKEFAETIAKEPYISPLDQ